ncbi:MAG: LTA synthase family protein [Lachnospiraceae bacterium]|nr:LTA synthase family protein [Lachnospiraceae bacterium]
MHKRVHIGVSIAAALFIGGWYYTVMEIPNPLGKEFKVSYWNVSATRSSYGASLSYFLLLKDNRIDVPKDYSEKKLQIIAENAEAEYGKKYQKTEQTPDIIMIMNEAWSDLRVLGELETTKEYMPFADGLEEEENAVKGNLYVSIIGGNTANTEFEALTGNSLSLLSPAVVPYQSQVQHNMPSLARVLKNQGYETMAMHPNGEGAWNRKQVYSYFGFDEFVHQGVWEVPYEYVRGFISDACNYKEIIHRYENRNKETPFFLFDVTIQNHSEYYGEIPLDIDVVNVGGIPAEEVGYLYDLQTYLNLIKISDDDLKELVTYFEQVDTPVIICIFGDHQPWLYDDFYEAVFAGEESSEREQNLQKYIVPYVMWANYDVDWEEYGDMSANYLPAALMECANLELPPFYQYLMELHQEYPVLTKMGCLDKEGNLVDITDIWDTDLIEQYRMLQYNQLYVESYQSNIFEKTILPIEDDGRE